MHVLLTGATGTIGSAILPALLARGHDVTAPVRSEQKAAEVEAAGATAVVDDLADTAHLVYLLRESDGAIHTASRADEHAESFDRGVAEAAVQAFGGTGTPYVHTGGCWVYGSSDSITEEEPYNPPALTAWRPRVQEVLERGDLAWSVVHPGIVYGGRRTILDLVADGPRTDGGALTTVGSGEQHWVTIHVDDLAALYVAVLEAGSGFGAVLGVNGQPVRVRELSAAAAGDAEVATTPDDEVAERVGGPFAEALLLDQVATVEKARAIGGWAPIRPSATEWLRRG